MYKCLKCGRTTYIEGKRHFYMGKVCDGEWQEGKLVWIPKVGEEK